MSQLLRIGLAISHPFAFYRGILRGIRTYAEARPDWIFTSLILEGSRRWWTGPSKPDGVIAALNAPAMVKALERWRGPVVNVSAIIPGLPFPNVRVDNHQVGQLAADHFLDRGLRHFAFVGQPYDLVGSEREAAFRSAVATAGYFLACYHDKKSRPYDPFGRRWPLDRGVQRWLRELPKPVGILAEDDVFGMQLAEACHQADLRVPEEVALLGVDNDDLYCEFSRPALSSVVLPTQRIGYDAAGLLERLMKGEKPSAQPLLLQPLGVVTRGSSDMLAIDEPDVVAALHLIRESAHLPIRAADVLKKVPISRRTLHRRFHELLGRGVGAEIRRVHLERAKRLLAETELSIEAVAQQCGFTDFRQLARVFRRDLGCSPTAYRRRVKTPLESALLVRDRTQGRGPRPG